MLRLQIGCNNWLEVLFKFQSDWKEWSELVSCVIELCLMKSRWGLKSPTENQVRTVQERKANAEKNTKTRMCCSNGTVLKMSPILLLLLALGPKNSCSHLRLASFPFSLSLSLHLIFIFYSRTWKLHAQWKNLQRQITLEAWKVCVVPVWPWYPTVWYHCMLRCVRLPQCCSLSGRMLCSLSWIRYEL